MRYLPLTETDREDMLARIGVSEVDALFSDVPAGTLLLAVPMGVALAVWLVRASGWMPWIAAGAAAGVVIALSLLVAGLGFVLVPLLLPGVLAAPLVVSSAPPSAPAGRASAAVPGTGPDGGHGHHRGWRAAGAEHPPRQRGRP